MREIFINCFPLINYMEEDIHSYLITRKNDIKLLDVKERLIEIKPTKDFILSIIGPRRSGKTYLLYFFIKDISLSDSDYLFVNFEEIEGRISDFITAHQEIYGKYPEYLFLDEIQSLKNWEKEVYRLYERKRFYIFLTGSSSKLLSKEIATQLRGRSLTIKVFPFSFREVLFINKLAKKFYSYEEIGRIRNLLWNCIRNGCFPDIVLRKVEASKFFSEYIDLVIYRDIMERYGVKNRVALEFFIKNAIASSSCIFSINKVYNTMKSRQIKVSKNTLYEFQKFLMDINMIFFLKKYSRSIRKIELSLPKTYIVDNGLYTFTIYKYEKGILMESFVLQELVKRGYEPNINIFYLRDNNYEIDFIIRRGLNIEQLIQVTYASDRDEIERREIKALIKGSKLLGCKNLTLITWTYEDKMKVNNRIIKITPLWKWLLEQNKDKVFRNL